MKVVVLTTSYPRDPADSAGRFVADAVKSVERRGVEVTVVSPATFRHFGLAYDYGIVQNLRREPWRVLAVPGFMAAYALAARRAARDADLVHAHWLPSALAARVTRKPYVLQLWGTDVELARRVPLLSRPLLRGAAAVVAASPTLAAAGKALGAAAVEVIPAGVEVPDEVAEPDRPPHVLFVGRLSEEKGILEFLEATEGIPRVVVGDGPLRARVPEAVGFVPPADLGRRYERSSVVCVPSRREGYGMTAREAMARGRAVVACDTGGLRDAIRDEETGLLVPVRDPKALRDAVLRLMSDDKLRTRLGTAARAAAREQFSQDAEATSLIALWERVAE
jgi:glycosyltransferase involved in cell wall biosynthesis